MAVRNEFVWSEHHRRPEKCGVGKRGEDRQFAFPTFTDIERRRASISTDSRNMDEPLDSSSVRLDCQPLSQLHVHRMERVPSALNVKTNRIHHTVSASKRVGD